MGLTEEQVAELRRLSERAMKDIIRHGDDQETIEALQEGVIALLADRDSLRARVGELEAEVKRFGSDSKRYWLAVKQTQDWLHTEENERDFDLQSRQVGENVFDFAISELERQRKLLSFCRDRVKQIRFLADGRDDNDPTPKGITTDWRRIIEVCDGILRSIGPKSDPTPTDRPVNGDEGD